jgi:hypothetical protein
MDDGPSRVSGRACCMAKWIARYGHWHNYKNWRDANPQHLVIRGGIRALVASFGVMNFDTFSWAWLGHNARYVHTGALETDLGARRANRITVELWSQSGTCHVRIKTLAWGVGW